MHQGESAGHKNDQLLGQEVIGLGHSTKLGHKNTFQQYFSRTVERILTKPRRHHCRPRWVQKLW